MKLFAFLLAASSLPLAAFDHSAWDDIVSKHVDGRDFDYAGAKRDGAKLDAYLESVAKVKRADYNGWNDGEKLAFLINLYNAATVDLVLDHYPVKSIRDIGGKSGPWKLSVVRVFGRKITLDHLEHEMIRKWFAEPRIHFAVNCASIGCPPLRDEAYTGKQLELQLREQTKAFLGNQSINRLDGGTLLLSPLFDWFKADFAKSAGSVEEYVARNFPKKDAAKIRAGVKLKFGEYDWSLNDD